ncbi:hypothetical protein AA983_01410 [Dermacoccus sp. PE3]|uniref:ROK family transcriptional regulator n=1 Tax=Dermacoccus sp. PE3 TaxID=1641401 RepID=UPI0006424535|nr:ROK family transcriptional regulator [Dermacoccus sp. PE3]KLO63518.1 hypothetical protein AA983_01410 [Dermacoccus sp. PE3]
MTDTTSHLVRASTDRRVLTVLVHEREATRASLAESAGLSRPTAATSVSRLVAAGLVEETGERTSGRGRSTAIVRLAPQVGVALALVVAPVGVSGVVVDIHGDEIARARSVDGPHEQRLTRVAKAVLARVSRDGLVPVRCAAVSVADPVDRHTGRAVQLPDEPFLVGELDARAALADLCDDVIVDNDVNWAANTLVEERCVGLIHLGEGLGAAIIEDGRVLRGGRGLAGEIGHIVVPGPDGTAIPFTEVFARLGLRQPGSSAVDVERLLEVTASDDSVRQALAVAVSAVVASLVGWADPSKVVVTGPWAKQVAAAVRAEVARSARPVDVVTALDDDATARGVRLAAVERLQATVLGVAVSNLGREQVGARPGRIEPATS